MEILLFVAVLLLICWLVIFIRNMSDSMKGKGNQEAKTHTTPIPAPQKELPKEATPPKAIPEEPKREPAKVPAPPKVVERPVTYRAKDVENEVENPEAYHLGVNELPQGKYKIGRDIPAGTYDFFVLHGDYASVVLETLDAYGNRVGDWTYDRVGLKEKGAHRELIHVQCKSGQTLSISGNVVLKIVKSQKVKIDL